MKIGILTHTLGYNYGGILQAWALQQVLCMLGYKSQTIDWAFHIPQWRWFFRGLPGAVYAKISGKDVKWPKTPKWAPENYRGLRQFVKRNMDLSPRITFDKIIPYIIKHYQIIIVGSDQVWRRPYVPNIESMFLPFVKKKNQKKITYGASFGTDEWEYSEEETIKCRKLLSDFDNVSVRERSAIDLCAKKLDFYETKWVIDPTLLITKSKYEVLCADFPIAKKGYVLAYILDSNQYLVNSAHQKAEELNLDLVLLSVDNKVNPTDTVEHWLASFRDAKYIITDSFHGTIFSLIFHKPFAVYRNKGRGNARFDSLIQLFPQIKERFISQNGLPDFEINWKSIDESIQLYKKDSLEFLICALSN